MITAFRVLYFTIPVTALCNAFGVENRNGPKSILESQAAIETVLKETKIPGAAITIVSRDKAEWVAGVGKADVAANKPATADCVGGLERKR